METHKIDNLLFKLNRVHDVYDAIALRGETHATLGDFKHDQYLYSAKHLLDEVVLVAIGYEQAVLDLIEVLTYIKGSTCTIDQ